MADGDLSETIQNTAAGPAEAHDQAGGMRAQPLRDLVAADEHLARKAAARSKALPIRVGIIRPPGAV